MKRLSGRQLRLLLILGPSAGFLLVYLLISILFVNTTDRHMLTTNRELKQYKAGMYHCFINTVHEKMLFVQDKKPKSSISHSSRADSMATVPAKQVAH